MSDTARILIQIIVAHAVVLALVLLVIKRLLLGDTVRAVSRIGQAELEVRKREEGIRREIEEHEKEFARKKAEAEESVQAQRQAAERDMSRLRDQVIADAKIESERIIDQAHKKEEKLRQQVERSVGEKAVLLGGEIFRMVMGDKVNQAMNRHFVEELLDALEQMDPSGITVDGTETEAISSHPLDPDLKERLQRVLAEKFRLTTPLREQVDAALVAGMVLKMGSTEIDASLRTRCQEAVDQLKKEA